MSPDFSSCGPRAWPSPAPIGPRTAPGPPPQDPGRSSSSRQNCPGRVVPSTRDGADQQAVTGGGSGSLGIPVLRALRLALPRAHRPPDRPGAAPPRPRTTREQPDKPRASTQGRVVAMAGNEIGLEQHRQVTVEDTHAFPASSSRPPPMPGRTSRRRSSELFTGAGRSGPCATVGDRRRHHPPGLHLGLQPLTGCRAPAGRLGPAAEPARSSKSGGRAARRRCSLPAAGAKAG